MNKIFYINLAERKDRNEHMNEEFKKCGIDYKQIVKIEAVDGRKLTNDTVCTLVSNSNFNGQSFTRQALGCFMSHSLIWQLIVDRNISTALVLEDDISFIDNFKELVNNLIQNLPDNTEIVSIGLPQFENVLDINNQTEEITKKLFIKKINNYIGVLHPDINPGTLGYIITNKGAKNLLSTLDITGFTCSVDSYINSYLEMKNIRYASTITLATTVSKFGSDISGFLPIIIPAKKV